MLILCQFHHVEPGTVDNRIDGAVMIWVQPQDIRMVGEDELRQAFHHFVRGKFDKPVLTSFLPDCRAFDERIASTNDQSSAERYLR